MQFVNNYLFIDCMQANQTNNNTTNTTMNKTAKIVIAALSVTLFLTLGYALEQREDVKVSRKIIETLLEDIHKSDEELLKTHQKYSWGVGRYFEGEE